MTGGSKSRIGMLAVLLTVGAAAVAVFAVVNYAGAGGGAGSIGSLSSRGCIDDNDFATDPDQGEDTCARSTNGLYGSTSVAISGDGRSVYTASESEDAIVRFNRNRRTGRLTPKGCVEDHDNAATNGDTCAKIAKGLDGVTSLALSRDGRSLYAVSEQDDAIVIFRRSHSGALSNRGCIDDNDFGTDPTQGEDSCSQSANGLAGGAGVAVSRDGRSVYATSENDGALVRFKRNRQTGKLAPRGCIDDNDTGSDTCAKSANGLDQSGPIVISSDGRSVYVGSEGDASVARFKRNRNTGSLKSRGCVVDSDNPSGETCAQTAVQLDKPDGIALSPDGRSLYVSASNDSAVVRFARNRQTGKLTAKGCIGDAGAPLAGCKSRAHGLAEISGITVSPDGRSLYVAAETDDAIVRFSRNRSSGALNRRGCIDDNDFGTDPTQGEDSCAKTANGMQKMSSVVVSRDGRSLYATSETDDAVLTFKRKAR